jgi:nucleoside-diphosphate-sugar epimerase
VLAFAAAGWQVTAQLRRAPRQPLPAGVRPLECDALDLPALTEAARAGGGLQVIVNALNPDYTQWARLLPPITAATIALAAATGATLMLPGNVYNYGNQLPAVLGDDTPFAATHPKAAQRIALEQALADAAHTQGVRSIVIRAGDFLGDAGTWVDLAMAKGLARGRFTQMGPADQAHAWAYLPDLALTFVRVAEQSGRLPAFATLHFQGHTLTLGDWLAGLQTSAGPLRTQALPWPLLRVLGLVSPTLRSLCQMRYLWRQPHRLDNTALRALIGAEPHTPWNTALRQSLQALGLTRPPARPGREPDAQGA